MELILFPVRLVFALLWAAVVWYVVYLFTTNSPYNMYSMAVVTALVFTWAFSLTSNFTSSSPPVSLNRKLHLHAVLVPGLMFLVLALATAHANIAAKEEWETEKQEIIANHGQAYFDAMQEQILQSAIDNGQIISMAGDKMDLPPRYNYIFVWDIATLIFPVIGILFSYYKTQSANKENELIRFMSGMAEQNA